jgi:small subunit ribosomal protein S18
MAMRLRSKRKQVCDICKHKLVLSYKKPQELRRYVNRVGKILPRRVSRMCAKHQRAVSKEIKRARVMALLPYQLEESTTGDERKGRRGGGRRR